MDLLYLCVFPPVVVVCAAVWTILTQENQKEKEKSEAMNWIETGRRTGYVTDGLGRKVKVEKVFARDYNNCFIAVMDNFLTPREASGLLQVFDKYKSAAQFPNDLWTGGIRQSPEEQRRSSTAKKLMFDATFPHARMKKLIARMKPFLCRQNGYTFREYAHMSTKLGVIPHVDASNFTLIIYLNDVPQNAKGCTVFGNLDIKFQPKAGRAVWFKSTDSVNINSPSGVKIDPLMEHSGEAVRYGRKVIIQVLSRNL